MPSTAIDRIDGISTSEAVKVPVRAGTLGNITLSGLQTIDGVVLVANDRVLVKNQTNQVNNGIYTAQVLTWIREPDFDGARDAVQGTIVQVYAGTTQALTWWNVSTANPIVIGSSSITFVPTYAGFNPIAQATETTLGIAEIATQAETNTGTDDLRIVTPLKLQTKLGLYVPPLITAALGDDVPAAVTSSGSANAYVVTYNPATTQLITGRQYPFIANFSNTGTATVNVDGHGVKSLTKSGANALTSGDVSTGQLVETFYDGTNFQMTSPISINKNIYFSVNKNGSSQSGIITTTDTKITLGTAIINIGGFYDAANSRFLPPAGTYMIIGQVVWTAGIVDQALYIIQLEANGSSVRYRNFFNASGTQQFSSAISAVLALNGTDYLELFVNGSGVGNKTISGAITDTFFQGYRIGD